MIAGSAIFCYDGNGNMTQKIDGSTTSYTYDAENRMTAVSGAASATFVYDGNGNRVKGVVGGVTTTYIGNYFEWTPFGKTTLRVQAGSTSTMKKYYYAGGTPSGEGKRVAERKGTTLYWLLSDHLGSTSITANSSGSKTAELRYKAWGETRYTYGTTQTTFRYTGQREESSLGLYWYNSRWYSPFLARFIQADTIIPQPGNPQAWDRYGYVNSNPVRYTDPSGHMRIAEGDSNDRYIKPVIPKPNYYNTGNSEVDNPSTQLGHTIYYEGGGDDARMAVNIMQTIHNRAYNAWNCSINHCNNAEWAKINPGLIPWNKITSAQYTRLILYLVSTPYTGSAGGVHPAYNGWETARNVEAFEQNPILARNFNSIVEVSKTWLNLLPGSDPLSAPIFYDGEKPDAPIRNSDVMYFYSSNVDLSESLFYVHIDRWKGRYQYYSTAPLP